MERRSRASPSTREVAADRAGSALPPDAAAEIARALAGAKRPLVVTSYLGRIRGRGQQLVALRSGWASACSNPCRTT